MCGEQIQARSPLTLSNGSPPRVRGTVPVDRVLLFYLRITPACAGNSRPTFVRPCPNKDHPRVCGEQLCFSPSSTATAGSPPRVRGTEDDKLNLDGWDRITPACAGNSCNPHLEPSFHRDHPRVCGEQSGQPACWGLF